MGQKIRITIFAAATAAMLVIIFIFSNQPGELSSGMSEGFWAMLYGTWLGRVLEAFQSLTGLDVRKDAHMFLYLLLGLCATMMFRSIVIYRRSACVDMLCNSDSRECGSAGGREPESACVDMLCNSDSREYGNVRGWEPESAYVGAKSVTYGKRIWFYPLYAFIFCVVAAVFDECHQLFIPGREGKFHDVCIDGIGFVAAIAIVCLCDFIVKSVRKCAGNTKTS